MILSLLLRGKEGSGRLRLEAPGVLFSVLKRRREEGGEDGYLANKQTEKEDPPPPPPLGKKRRVELGKKFSPCEKYNRVFLSISIHPPLSHVLLVFPPPCL